jgi:hypothetical protein
MSPPAVGPESEVPARHREPALTTTATVDTTKHNGHEPSRLRTALESARGSLKSLIVLAPQNDPFRVDTDAGHRDGAWLASALDRLSITGHRHLRGLHYILIGQPKPNGQPYTNTDKDWTWLAENAAKAARWLGYIPFNRIVDQRNDEPEIREWRASPAAPDSYVSVNFDVRLDVSFDGVTVPDADDLTPYAGIWGFTAEQPYHLVLVGEKSSLRPVLSDVADRYSADLYLPTGEISDTQAHHMAHSAALDARPLKIFYFSDADPAGWQMPISLARKLQGLKAIEFDELDFQIYRVALTPDQVREYDLPSTPLRDTERRADKWMASHGIAQTEIDALAGRRPDLLRQIANDFISKFYDDTLNRRVRLARDEWRRHAQQSVDEQSAEHRERISNDVAPLLDEKRAEIDQVLNEVREALDEKEEQIRAVLDAVHLDPGMFELPPVPPVPAPMFGDQPEPLCDSVWDFTEQCQRLIASKNYDTNGHHNDGYVG